MPKSPDNLFSNLKISTFEQFEPLLKTAAFHLEKIISIGQKTPAGQWLNSQRHEWVLVVQGSAALMFEGQAAVKILQPGDHCLILAGQNHRVEWTNAEVPTVWLALHFDSLPHDQLPK